jgi:hypothetical protein
MPMAGCRGGIKLKRVKARLSITGATWPLKGKPDALNDLIIEAVAGELLFRKATGHVILYCYRPCLD